MRLGLCSCRSSPKTPKGCSTIWCAWRPPTRPCSASRTGSRTSAGCSGASRDLRGLRDVPGDPPATGRGPGAQRPIAGLFDLGRFPGGADETAALVAGALGDSGFESLVFGDIMRWKYAKLLSNLTNAVEALCGPAARGSDLAKAARQEGRDVLAGSGVAYVDDAEYRERRGDKISIAPTASGPWSGAPRGRVPLAAPGPSRRTT